MRSRGHEILRRAADVRIEAWGRSREECLTQAAQALAASFTDAGGVSALRAARLHLPAEPPPELLVSLLDELIELADTRDDVPVTIRVRAAADGGVDAKLGLARLGSVRLTGHAPKAVSPEGLTCEQDPSGRWSAGVTVTVGP